MGFSADLRLRFVYLVCLQGKTIAQAAKDLYVSQLYSALCTCTEQLEMLCLYKKDNCHE